MTLEKAIEILNLEASANVDGTMFDLRDAIHLGIEALKLLKELRQGSHDSTGLELPGETPE